MKSHGLMLAMKLSKSTENGYLRIRSENEFFCVYSCKVIIVSRRPEDRVTSTPNVQESHLRQQGMGNGHAVRQYT